MLHDEGGVVVEDADEDEGDEEVEGNPLPESGRPPEPPKDAGRSAAR